MKLLEAEKIVKIQQAKEESEVGRQIILDVFLLNIHYLFLLAVFQHILTIIKNVSEEAYAL